MAEVATAETEPQAECMFCLTPATPERIFLRGCECKFAFHDKCILEWFSRNPNSCPLCRKQVRVCKRLTEQQIKAQLENEKIQSATACCMFGCICIPFLLQFL